MQQLFVVTYGRSGSTLLQHILNSIPGYCIRGENKNALYGLFQSTQAIKEAKATHPLDDDLPSYSPYYGIVQVDAGTYERRLAECFMSEVLRPDPTTRVVGFKEISWFLDEPSFEQFLDFVLRAFPSAKLLFNVRDPVATAASGWWANKDRDETVAKIARYRDLMIEYDARCGRSIVIDYDEYTNDPSALVPVYAFLGEAFDAALVGAIMAKRLMH